MIQRWAGIPWRAVLYARHRLPRFITKRRLIWTGFGLFSVTVVVTALQLVYPPDRLLPFVRINGEAYGGQTAWQAITALDAKYKDATVELKTSSGVERATFEQVGIHITAVPTVHAAAAYSLTERLTPFSSFVIMARRNTPLKVRVDNQRVHYFAEQFALTHKREAVNASVAVSGDAVSLAPAKPSEEYSAVAVYRAIISAPLKPKLTFKPDPITKQPEITNEVVEDTVETAQDIVSTPLTLTIGDASVTVDKAVVASWLDFPATGSNLELNIKTEAIKAYVAALKPHGYEAPRPTRITLVDGREAERVVGIAGRGVNVNEAASLITERLKSRTGGALALPTEPLAPTMTFSRTYSDTSAGLTAYMADLIASHGNYGITVIELGGKGRSANVNGDKVYVAASMYKMYVAYGVFKLTESGEMQWNDSVGGMQVDSCLEAMIVHSDNGCAYALGERVGWGRVQDMMRAIGLGGTSLSADGKYTTANDQAAFLRKLEDGTLLPEASRNVLLGYMKRQVYRNGIPAATRLPVANKVGRYGSYVHDAGIVYAPGGTYILSIMSSGNTWNGLTVTAREVHEFIIK